ncbi:sporulation protein YqfD [Ornithinibacillus contaminans]|uniref:sporulation protein YqfD n=1 Tax=Ornithinibacillus contaminans TaxID=694055 RepID=UPI00064D8542|nr:sporulation protein YqfD [Ornithinibacillus contaminans]
MKRIQGSFIQGYVRVLVKGDKPELFFQECVTNGLSVWDIKREGANSCSGNVKLADIKRLKQLKRKKNYKISFQQRRGYPFIFTHLVRRKELVISCIMSILLILFLSNIIWKVEIQGDLPQELEKKITAQLTEYGVHPGAWIFTLDTPGTIQRKLTEDIPELLWVGVRQKGTSFQLEGVEKIVVNEEKEEGARNLIASKKGIIKNMYVSKGVPRVAIHDYVKPGDLLISGSLYRMENGESTDKEQRNDNRVLVAAEGEVIASTWYEVEVTVPLKQNYELLTGNQEKKYYLGFQNVTLPIWGFGSPEFTEIHRDLKETPIRFFKWELPINMVEMTLSEKRYYETDRSKEEAVQVGIAQAREELQLQLGPEAKITSEKVLHESEENGKVKLYLYMTVEENITKAQPITQGD